MNTTVPASTQGHSHNAAQRPNLRHFQPVAASTATAAGRPPASHFAAASATPSSSQHYQHHYQQQPQQPQYQRAPTHRPRVHRHGSSDESANTTSTNTTTQTARSGVSFSTAETGTTNATSVTKNSSSSSGKHDGSTCSSSRPQHQESSAPRVVFGPGTVARLPTELGRLRLTSPLIVSSPSRIALARRIQALIPNLNSRILDSAVVNVPPRVVDNALSRITGQDCVISIGGGSAVDLAKVISVRKRIPHICIPSTYSGSEVGTFTGQRSPFDGRQASSDESKTMPTVIIYDEDLTASPSKRFSAPSASSAASQMSEASSRRSSRGENSQWSYIHLPGV